MAASSTIRGAWWRQQGSTWAKLDAAVEKGLYDHSQKREHFDRMMEKLAGSVKEYARLEELASPAYRQATDIGE